MAVLLGLGLLGQAVKTDYNSSFTVSGTDSATARHLLGQTAPAQAGDADTIVWRVDHGLSSSDQGNDPASGTTRKAYDLLAEGFGPGFDGPLLLVARTGRLGRTVVGTLW